MKIIKKMGYRGFVKYWDLGRSNVNGSFFLTAEDEGGFNRIMEKEFSKHLMSKDISFANGNIYAGARPVGNFSFIAVQNGEQLNNVIERVHGQDTDPKLATTRNERKTAHWGKDTPMTKETQEKLFIALEKHIVDKKYDVDTSHPKDMVRRSVLYCPVAVEHVWDNENEAQKTIEKLKTESGNNAR